MAAAKASSRPIGTGPRFHPPPPRRAVRDCRPTLGRRVAAHLELFAADRVVLIPAGIGTELPRRLEAGRIISRAGERAQTMIGQQELHRRAEKQAETMLKEAAARADEVRRSADAYAFEAMRNLEAQLLKTMATVRKGVEALRQSERTPEPAGRR